MADGEKSLDEVTAERDEVDQLVSDGIASINSEDVHTAVNAAKEVVGAEPPQNRHKGLIPRLRFFVQFKKQLADLLKTVRGKPVVLLHGTTSCGKSTLSLRLKSDYEPTEFVEEVIKTTNKMTNAGETKKFETDDGNVIEIGTNQPQGTTIIPNIFYIEDDIGEQMTVLDMPGLSDQDELHQFVISVVYRLIMQDLRNVVLASLVGARSILMPNFTNGWRDQCLESLHQILGHDLENFKMGVRCVTFIVNHFDQLSKLRRKRLKLPEGMDYIDKKERVHEKLIDIVARSANAPQDCLALYQQLQGNFMMVDYAEDEFSDIVGRFREMINPVLERNTVSVHQVGTFSLSGAEEAHRARDILNHLVDMQLAVRHAVDTASQRIKDIKDLLNNLIKAKQATIEYRQVALDDIDNKRFAGLIRRMNSASAPLSDKIAEIGAARDRLENIVATAHFLKVEAANQTPMTRCAVVRSTINKTIFSTSHDITANVDVASATFKGYMVYTGHNPQLENALRNDVASMDDVVRIIKGMGDNANRVLSNSIITSGHPDDPDLKKGQVGKELMNNDPSCFQMKLSYAREITLVVAYEVWSSGSTAGFFEDMLAQREKEYKKMIEGFKGMSRGLEDLRAERVALSKEREDLITSTDERVEELRQEAEKAHESAPAVFEEASDLMDSFEVIFSQGGYFGLCGQYLQFMKEHVQHTPAAESDNGPVELPTADSSDSSSGGGKGNAETFGAKAYKKATKHELATVLEFTESDFDGIPIGQLPVTKQEREQYDHELLSKMKADFARLQQDYNTAASSALAELNAMVEMPQDAPVLPYSFHQVEGITENWEEQKKRIKEW